jgi:hypothetical protein
VVAWTVDEFQYELGKDPKRRVLIVEGLRDLAFWRILIPVLARGDTVIYPISEIEIDLGLGGARGRLIGFAKLLQESAVKDRVHFFADKDYDGILGIATPENVTLTDWRDLEAYGLSQECLRKLGVLGLACPDAIADGLLTALCVVARPIAALRILSEVHGWQLPFQGTLHAERRYTRFFDGRLLSVTLNLERLVEALLQHGGRSLKEKENIITAIGRKMSDLQGYSNRELVHG